MPVDASNLYNQVKINLFKDGRFLEADAHLVREEELCIFINESYITTLVCSPGADCELALGHLLSEAILQQDSEIKSIDCSRGRIDIMTAQPLTVTESDQSQGEFKTRGLVIIEKALLKRSASTKIQFHASHLLDLVSELDQRAKTFKITGGVHSAALADNTAMLLRYEDIGRHNAVDKTLGCAFMNQISLFDKCLVLSGRISNEILAKAAQNGIPVILSRSAPTLQAVQWAEQLGMTTVGFARGSSFNVYTHPERIII